MKFKVQLCATHHHHQIHTIGKQPEWCSSATSIRSSSPARYGNKAAITYPVASADEESDDQAPGTQLEEQPPDVSRTQPPASS